MIPSVDMSNYEILGCLHDIFVKQANLTPNKIAVVSERKQITFGELNSITDALAQHLRNYGVGRNKVVGIFMERCIEYTISYIAILKTGGAYLPIEMSYPTSLIQSVLEDSKPLVIFTKSCYNSLPKNNVPIISLDNNWFNIIERENTTGDSISAEKTSLDDMAYTVYSSGTTGKPKGIQCPHRGAVFSYTWRHLAFPYDEDDREACNVFFVWEMLRPLLKGIPMYIIPDTVIYDPPKLLQFLRENAITRMLFTPSLLQTVLDTQDINLAESFRTMKQVWLCGEVVTTALRNRIKTNFPWIKILNLYSVSECHDISCSDLTEEIGLEGRTYCPVGKIFPRVQVKILDENMNNKPMGEAGEIFVGGPTLAIGYLERPDLNKQRFINIPSSSASENINRWYRTGDWGYLLSDDCLEVIGRCDSMVKIRGYTVELKAIENAVLNLSEINMVSVLAVGEEGSDKILVAYVVSSVGVSPSASDIRSKLKSQLPFYMIPSHFIFLDKIPILDATGKINKNELPLVRTSTFDESCIYIDDETMDKTAKTVAKIWCKMLKLGTVSPDDNFFDLGGHSLLAAITISKINEKLATSLSTIDLYANPTLNALTTKIKTGENCEDCFVDLRGELEKFTVKQVPNIKLHSFWKSINLSKQRFHRANVLLTGAAGFLGSFILQRLLNDTETVVYCLVRTSSSAQPTERLQKVLRARELSEDLLNTRVIPLAGDISLNKFGLEDAAYTALSYDIDFVIHCAACVNLVLPYSVLRPINVIGTSNVVSFCLEKKLKPLHYISTNDVFKCGTDNCCESADMSEHADELKHGYAQSKWLAEQIVLSASENGLPAIISRCGNIGGSQYSPTWNANDMILLILQGVIISGYAPDIPWQIELTPVDFVSDVIVKLTQNVTTTFKKIYHLINTMPVDCRILWSLLQETGYKIKLTSYDKWIEKVNIAAAECPLLKPLLHLLSTRLKTSDYLVKSSTFTQENLNEFLTANNLLYPHVNCFLLSRYIQNLSIGGYLPSPSTIIDALAKDNTVSRLKGKIALVTGASSGIGYTISKTLAKAGIVTVGVARTIENLEKLRDELKVENIDNFVPMQVDVTVKDEVFLALSKIKAAIGPVDILVNNAGVMEYGKMINCELDHWMNMMNVNCIGFLNVIAATLPHMANLHSGHIVNITSDAGKKAFAGLAVYSGTKFFEEAVSTAMRQELAPNGIKVSCIAPGDVSTGLHLKTKDKKTFAEYGYQIEYLEAQDIANTVLFILDQPRNCAVNSVLIEPMMGPI